METWFTPGMECVCGVSQKFTKTYIIYAIHLISIALVIGQWINVFYDTFSFILTNIK